MTDPDPTRIVELVVVHGMGSQKATETLLEWSEPILRRIDWLARSQTDRVRAAASSVSEATGSEATDSDGMPSTAPDDPAQQASAVIYKNVNISGSGNDEIVARVSFLKAPTVATELEIRITEARWAEAFAPLKRGQIFSWGSTFLLVALKNLGRYFARVVRHGARTNPLLLTVPAYLAIGGFTLLLVVVGAVLYVLLPLLSPLLLIPVFRHYLNPVLTTLAEFIGDPAAWTGHPVRAAAMRAIVRNAVDQARRSLDARTSGTETLLAVLAHSQGAAITADMLFSNVNREEPKVTVDALVTVGAGITLLGSPAWSKTVAKADPQDKLREKPLNLVRAWAKNHPRTLWLNFWGIWDPVPSGPISTAPDGRKERWRRTFGRTESQAKDFLGPEERPVHNTGIALTDHQTYAGNLVQVIDPVARLLMGMDSEDQSESRTSGREPTAGKSRAELHVRSVKALGIQRVFILATAIVMLFPRPYGRLNELLESISNWIADGFAWLLRIKPDEGFFGWVRDLEWFDVAVALLLFVIIAVVINESTWRSYARKVSWNWSHELPGSVWVSGLVQRIIAAILLVAALGAATPLEPQSLGFTLLTAVAGVVGLYMVVSPLFSPVPLVVPASRIETMDA